MENLERVDSCTAWMDMSSTPERFASSAEAGAETASRVFGAAIDFS